MGQRTSTPRVFGYFSSDEQDPAEQQRQHRHDRVLSRPEHYGLDPTCNLGNDFAAIDATYYCNDDDDDGNGGDSAVTTAVVAQIPSHETNDTQEQKTLTFTDIEHLVKDRKLRLHSRALVRLDNDIFYFKTVTKLDLSRNRLTHLPDALGSLNQLTHLCLSHNRLEILPDTIHGLVQLIELDLSYNTPLQCSSITPYLGHLKKLRTLDLSHNPALRELPIELGGLDSLSILYIHKCPKLQAVPAELLRLPNLRRIKIDKVAVADILHDLRHDPPSLIEVCARTAYKMQQQKQPHIANNKQLCDDASWFIDSNLPRPKPCSACGEPYFSSYVFRRRLEERPDGTLVLYEYRLCSEHWQDNDDDDRKRYMFSASLPIDHNVLKFLPLPSPRSILSSTSITANHHHHHTILQQNDNVVVDAHNKKIWKRWLKPVRLEHQPFSGTTSSSL